MSIWQGNQVLDKWGGIDKSLAPQEHSNSEDTPLQNNETNQEKYTDKVSQEIPLTEVKRNVKESNKSTSKPTHILVMGGCDENTSCSELFLHNLEQNNWKILSMKLPHPRHSHGTVVLNNKIYVIGGISSKGKERGLLRFNQKMQPEQQSSMNHPRADIASKCVIFNGSILVFGGDKKNSVEEYNMEHNGWQEIASLNPKSVYWGAAVIKNEIYVVGNDGIEKYDRENGIYEYVWETPELHGSISVLVHDTKIIVISGGKENWEFDVEDRNWGKLPSLSPSCSGFASTIAENGDIAITGGKHDDGSYHSVSYCNRSNWMPKSNDLLRRSSHTSIFITQSRVDAISKRNTSFSTTGEINVQQNNPKESPRLQDKLDVKSNSSQICYCHLSQETQSVDLVRFIHKAAELLLQQVDTSPSPNYNSENNVSDYKTKNLVPQIVRDIVKKKNVNKEDAYSNSIDNKNKPRCLIINNHKFEDQHKYQNREGTGKDFTDISKLFTDFGYEIDAHHELKADVMRKTLKTFADRTDHGDSLVVIVLTHGANNVFIGTDGEKVDIYESLQNFNGNQAKHLIGKPKLFFFQACREKEEKDSSSGSSIKVPVESDFLVAYATAMYKPAIRDTVKGSWFIQAICKIFREHYHEKDILHLMTSVNGRVHSKGKEGQQQASEMTSSLRKLFYFSLREIDNK